ncbi:hypothetical protein ABPG74_020078 [Tetrahymena malaccensis]
MISTDQQSFEEFIRVIVRQKPQILTQNVNEDQVVINQRDNSITLSNKFNDGTSKTQTFYFDTIFNEQSSQQQIYNNAVSPLVNSLFCGISSTIWAFGQACSGKRYTLIGNHQDEQSQGIVYRAADHIFSKFKHFRESKEEQKEQDEEFKVYVSVYTLYQEILEDMLTNEGEDLKIRENLNGIQIENLTKICVSNQLEFFKVLQKGIHQNLINVTQRSLLQSRQCFFIEISILKINKTLGTEQISCLKIVKFSGIEERYNKLNLQQALQIKQYNPIKNFSNVIYALSENNAHVPYRDSKLTRLIQGALGGNQRGLMIYNLNTQLEYEQIQCYLRIASRVQQVRNNIFFIKKQSYA